MSAARAAYDALTQKAKAEISQTLLNKLEAAEEKIEFYEKIDAAKKLLKELPILIIGVSFSPHHRKKVR